MNFKILENRRGTLNGKIFFYIFFVAVLGLFSAVFLVDFLSDFNDFILAEFVSRL